MVPNAIGAQRRWQVDSAGKVFGLVKRNRPHPERAEVGGHTRGWGLPGKGRQSLAPLQHIKPGPRSALRTSSDDFRTPDASTRCESSQRLLSGNRCRPERCYAHLDMLRAVAVFFCLAVLLDGAGRRLEFQNYPPDSGFSGPTAEPRFITAWSQEYRTRIRLGAASREGFWRGSKYSETPGPNFAGHYRVANWGCGAGCLMMVVVDLKTGAIYSPPMPAGAPGINQIGIPNLGTGWGDFDFRADSRLFIMKTCPWGSPDPSSPLYRRRGFCGTSYFVIECRGFRLMQRVAEELLPLPE
jgi:hypothetical protein